MTISCRYCGKIHGPEWNREVFICQCGRSGHWPNEYGADFLEKAKELKQVRKIPNPIIGLMFLLGFAAAKIFSLLMGH